MSDSTSGADSVARATDVATTDVAPTQSQPVLSVGDVAPDFELRDQNNQRVKLSRLLEERQVLIVFFPLAFTGTCQGELGFIRDHYHRFVNDEVAAVGVSVGPPPTHKVWSSAQASSSRFSPTSGRTVTLHAATGCSTKAEASLSAGPSSSGVTAGLPFATSSGPVRRVLKPIGRSHSPRQPRSEPRAPSDFADGRYPPERGTVERRTTIDRART